MNTILNITQNNNFVPFLGEPWLDMVGFVLGLMKETLGYCLHSAQNSDGSYSDVVASYSWKSNEWVNDNNALHASKNLGRWRIHGFDIIER